MITSHKTLAMTLLIAVIGAWQWRAHLAPSSLAGVQRDAAQPSLPSTVGEGLQARTSETPPPMHSGLYKCVTRHGISYSDAPCPDDAKRVAMDHGTVTVVAGQGLQGPSLPHLPTPGLLQNQEEAQHLSDIKEQRMDAAIGK